jgi:outer membrane lipoprotein
MQTTIKTTASIFAFAATAVLAGCATVPAPLAGTNFAPLTPQQAVAGTGTSGQRVRWGGEIIKVDPRADSTCFEILSRELYGDARPNRKDHSDGRFLACKQGFFDPAVYAKGRDITVVGTLDSSEKHKVGQFDYTFAKVAADEIYMWPKRTVYAGGYYDPFYGPCYGDPFWGSGFGPGWGGWGGGWSGCGGFGYGGYWGRPRGVWVNPPPPPPKTSK